MSQHFPCSHWFARFRAPMLAFADSLLAAVNRNDKRAVPGIVRELSLRARAADSLAEQLGGK